VLVLDVDATITIAHSEKANAAATWKKTFGFHPLLVFLDRPEIAGGEALAGMLRPGNAGSNTATDHIEVLDAALAGLPSRVRPRGPDCPGVLIRSDSAGATHTFAEHCRTQKVGFSFGFAVDHRVQAVVDLIPDRCWMPALTTGGDLREGAWVAEATGMIDLGNWPAGSRLILRKERPHPGAQLTFADVDGLRVTAFLTDTSPGVVPGQAAGLELRHRQHAQVEDRIREAKATGLPARGRPPDPIRAQPAATHRPNVALGRADRDRVGTTAPPRRTNTHARAQHHRPSSAPRSKPADQTTA